MTLESYTSDVSLQDLFRALQDNRQTGRLSLKPLSKHDANQELYSFWFHRGNLVAVTNRADGLGLLQLLQQRLPLKASTLPCLLQRCPDQQPLGKFLKDNGLLTPRQLRSLFTSQTLRYLCVLLQTPEIHFSFHPQEPLPYLEMTSVKIPATAMMMPGLRALKNWDTLQFQLPSSDSGLRKLSQSPPKVKLNTLEKAVLQKAEEGHSLAQIAQLLAYPTHDVLKTAFRLIFVGMAEEVPYIRFAASALQSLEKTQPQDSLLAKLSHHLQNISLGSPLPAKAMMP